MTDLDTLHEEFNKLPPAVRDAESNPGSLKKTRNLDLIRSKVVLAALMTEANKLRSADLEESDPNAGHELLTLRKSLNAMWDQVRSTLAQRGYEIN